MLIHFTRVFCVSLLCCWMLVHAAVAEELEVQVKARRKKLQQPSSMSRTEVAVQEMELLPQGGEAALPQVLGSTVPGIVLGPFGQLFFRGNHGSVQYQIDGVQVPDSPSNALGRLLSLNNLETMEVMTGGMPAEYGWKLGGVVKLTTRTGTEEPSGAVGAGYGSYSTFFPHIFYGGSDSTARFNYFVSAQYRRSDRGLDTPQPESYQNQKQGGRESVHNQSENHSQFVKLDWQQDNENKYHFIFLHSYDRFQIPNYPSSFLFSDPYFQPGYEDQFGNEKHHGSSPLYLWIPSSTNDVQRERNLYFQTAWKHTLSDLAFLQTAVYYKHSGIRIDNDRDQDLASLSAASWIPDANPASLFQDRVIQHVGIKSDWTYRVHPQHALKLGVQVQNSYSQGSLKIENKNGSFENSDPALGVLGGVYVQDDYRLHADWVLNAGLRYDLSQSRFSGVRSQDSLLQPRVGLNYFALPDWKLHAFYGRLFHAVPLENLRAAFNFLKPGLGPYDIQAQKDHYYELGSDYELFPKQLWTVTLFGKQSQNIVDQSQLLRTAIAQPYNFREGFLWGIESSLKGQWTSQWSHYVNYSYSVGKGKGISGGIWAMDHVHGDGGDAYFVLDHIQTHTANLGLTYSIDQSWWTIQGNYGSGFRTGEHGDIPLPGHVTFDTTVGYEFSKRASWFSELRVAGDVLNVLDHRYPITIANPFNGSRYAAGRQFMVRISKVL